MNQEEITAEYHEQWMQHPYTQQFFKDLKQHRANIVNKMASNSADFNTNEAQFRLFSYGIKTLDTVVEIASKRSPTK